MLTPKQYEELPNSIVKIVSELEEQVITDISKSLKKNMELMERDDYQLEMLYRMGYDLDEIEKEIANRTEIAEKELDKILDDGALRSYNEDVGIYREGGKVLPPLDENLQILSFVDAIKTQTKSTFKNFTNTMGFAADAGNLKDLTDFYRETLDYATFQVGSGLYGHNEALKQAVKKIGDSGIRTIDYASGRTYHIESATRMTVLTGLGQITGYMSEANADMMEQDLMEITAHMGSRPSHQDWQGQLVSRSGRRGYLSLSDIGYDTAAGFKGANCRHDWFPFFEGISTPAYNEKDLKDIDPRPFNYKGRIYTAYEATQRQRQIERYIKKHQRRSTAYTAAELEDEKALEEINMRRWEREYESFSKAAGIRPKFERIYTYGYKG